MERLRHLTQMSFLVCGLVISLAACASASTGTLVIVGGGERPDEIFTTFMSSSGGTQAKICLVTTATEDPEGVAEEWKTDVSGYGATLSRLDVTTREQASSSAVLETARACTGVWFVGGDQSRVGDAIVGTPLQQLLLKKYRDEGAAVGGTSAGAAIMSRIMLTGEDLNGQEKLEEIGRGAYKTREGMGFLPDDCIVDQHFLRRNRENRLFSVLMSHPDHFGLGIDEETALVVKGGKATVLGNRYVMVINPQGAQMGSDSFTGMKVDLLSRGQSIDLSSRKINPAKAIHSQEAKK